MKKYIVSIAIAAVLSVVTAFAADKVNLKAGAGVDNVVVERVARNLDINMDILLSQVDVPSNKAYLLTPVLVKGDKSVDLPAIGLYSRGSYLQYIRNGRKLASGEERTYSKKNMPATVAYEAKVRFEGWMDGADLFIRQDEYGCRNCLAESTTSAKIGGYATKTFTFVPDFVYSRPEAEVTKSRSISGQAFVDFAQGRTDVAENYHSNATELAKIRATIDSVRRDKDITINSITLKGYASPEGKHALNEKLASVRTGSIKDYVKNIYNLDNSKFKATSVAENWEGLREFVEKSDLPHRKELLALIDDMDTYKDLDAKEWKLKSTYPEDYKVIVEACYPYLRRTDYKVDYTIRSYATAAEVEEVLKSRPGNLSLDEFYLAAQNHTPGSEAFNQTFLTAARTFPYDQTANLNAAVALMQEGALDQVQKYLDKAGSTGLAVYARGLYAALKGDFDAAEDFFRKAEKAGVEKARGALAQMEYRKELLGL